MSQQVGKTLGRFMDSAKKEIAGIEKDLKDAGVSIKDDRMLVMRLDTMKEFLWYMRNDSIDIEDKIEDLDDTVIMAGYAWGRGQDNRFWAELITHWRCLMIGWRGLVLQRHFYPMVTVPVQVKVGEEWVEKTFRESTALELERTRGKESVRLGSPIVDAGFVMDQDEDPAFNQEQIEAIVKKMGEILIIEIGLLVLAYAFSQIDVTTQRVFIFHNSQPMMPTTMKNEVPAFAASGSFKKSTREAM